MDISTYYTRLWKLWDELKDFQPVSVCSCGTMKEWMVYQNNECVMQFLMGINDSYTQIRAQILMMDPTLTISKIFSLVIQEERQRSIHNEVSSSSKQPMMNYHSFSAATMKGPSHAKGAKSYGPSCSHCHFPGHTVDKCYRVHGYPSGHPRNKQKSSDPRAHVNQASFVDSNKNILAGAGATLSPEQCKQLIAFLSSQFQLGYGNTSDAKQLDPSVSCFSDIFSSSLGFPSILHTDWVLDTGATHHICCSLSLFHTSHPTTCVVTLPNNSTTTATHIGSVRLSPDFTLHNVLSKIRRG